MAKNTSLLSAEDPHYQLLLEMQKKGILQVKDMSRQNVDDLVAKLSPDEANYVRYLATQAHRSVGKHIQDNILDKTSEWANRYLPLWLTSLI